CGFFFFFFFNDTATTEIYTLSLHDALPICQGLHLHPLQQLQRAGATSILGRSEEHTSELQSHLNLVCRLLLEKKKHKPYSRRYSDETNEQKHKESIRSRS